MCNLKTVKCNLWRFTIIVSHRSIFLQRRMMKQSKAINLLFKEKVGHNKQGGHQ
jgi:hypothetical protein